VADYSIKLVFAYVEYATFSWGGRNAADNGTFPTLPTTARNGNMRFYCPHCSEVVKQARNWEGPNFCPGCEQLFDAPPEEKMPPWILGVVVFLAANLQIHWHMAMCHP
jgi:hypothetical protein